MNAEAFHCSPVWFPAARFARHLYDQARRDWQSSYYEDFTASLKPGHCARRVSGNPVWQLGWMREGPKSFSFIACAGARQRLSAHFRRRQPFDPALPDLRLNRDAARSTNSTSKSRAGGSESRPYRASWYRGAIAFAYWVAGTAPAKNRVRTRSASPRRATLNRTSSPACSFAICAL